MTKIQFPGPALSVEQMESLQALATGLTPEQSQWVGGYFTGYADAARLAGTAVAPASAAPAVAVATAAQRSLTVLYASETGNGIGLAEEIGAAAAERGLTAAIIDMADYKPAALKQEQDLLLVASTHGEGEPAQPALGFYEFLDSRKAPRLEGVRFAVMALGDSTYEFYCEAGKRLDRRFEELGAQRLLERIDCDVDQLADGRDWACRVLETLAAEGAAAAPATPVPAGSATPGATSATRFDETHPFLAEVLENIVITGRGSSKETRHIELGLAGSGLTYAPGDALGIVGRNEPRLVADVISATGLDADSTLTLEGSSTTLAAALETQFEIATATPRFLAHWAELSGASALTELAAADRAAERVAFLEANHVIDILKVYPVPGLTAGDFVSGLRRLQPRLYSIASSQPAQDGDVHLTVSTVHYALHGSERWGVVSGALTRLEEEASLPVYVKPNPHFRLPADDVPVVMIGAGTGIAPFRAFLQDRELRGASGRSWLFFGERNFRSDFLYQTEWQEYLRNGTLTWMDVAFSRDGADKTYVQHRLLERGYELYGWLQDGAHLYVCGDAKGMAPDVNRALVDLVGKAAAISTEAAEDYVRDLQRTGRYQRDVY